MAQEPLTGPLGPQLSDAATRLFAAGLDVFHADGAARGAALARYLASQTAGTLT
jgi:hypothetical protein